MTAPIDYNAVLADLMAKRTQIDAAIEVIRSLIGSSAIADSGNGDSTSLPTQRELPPSQGTPSSGVPIQSDTFFGLTTAAAVRKYLSLVKRPQTPTAIAEAIHRGGQVHAADLESAFKNVYTALSRSKDFVKTRNKEWGLAEWYANRPKGDAE